MKCLRYERERSKSFVIENDIGSYICCLVELLTLDFEGMMLYLKSRPDLTVHSSNLLKIADSFEIPSTLWDQINDEWLKHSHQNRTIN
jgi:hypothetical protein